MSLKVDTFFTLLRAVYGASRYESQWPDSTHEEAAKILWESKIEKHTEAELKAAIEHAQRMSIKGEKDWQWPNVGLILSGARRDALGSHKLLLGGRERTEAEKQVLKERALNWTKNIKSLLDDKPEEESKEEGEYW